MKRFERGALWLCVLAAPAAIPGAEAVDLTPVIAKPISRTVELPGEIQAFLSVGIHARIPGYVEKVLVDRGSVVKQGDELVVLSAPEIAARIAEAEWKVQSAESDRMQAEAQRAAAESTLEGLKKASESAGAVAGNELVQAQKQVDAAAALVRSREQTVKGAQANLQAQRDLEQYLRIQAPFEGVVTERLVHPGALVGPGADAVLLTLEQTSRLRVVVPVPEEDLGSMVRGAVVHFRVPAWPERSFTGKIARVAQAVDVKTRTMAVELDVLNRDGVLAPGMYPSVAWPVRTAHPGLFVPKLAVVRTTERVFVIRDREGRAEWVDVKTGQADGDLVEVMGNLRAGDQVVKRGTDEIRESSSITARGR